MEVRYPSDWGGAAAVRVEDDTIYTSVAPEVINDSTARCMETGAILESHKFNKKVTHRPQVQCAISNDTQAIIFKN